mmetsp:Transcript_44966/g.116468  ORF Transcript_44966/g.116468 Transcript_44966/m.116468 type:complete len:203 (+) Transcript_44966:119-727(+)
MVALIHQTLSPCTRQQQRPRLTFDLHGIHGFDDCLRQRLGGVLRQNLRHWQPLCRSLAFVLQLAHLDGSGENLQLGVTPLLDDVFALLVSEHIVKHTKQLVGTIHRHCKYLKFPRVATKRAQHPSGGEARASRSAYRAWRANTALKQEIAVLKRIKELIGFLLPGAKAKVRHNLAALAPLWVHDKQHAPLLLRQRPNLLQLI